MGQALSTLPECGSAPELRRAGPGASRAAQGRDVRLPALPARGSNIGDDGRPGGTREVEGTLLGIPPVVHHHPPLPPSLVIHSFAHSFISSFINSLAIWTSCPNYPQPQGLVFPFWPPEGSASLF